MDATELLLHPARLRIIHATFDGEPFTTSQLSERLPDISKPTLYRQVGVLVDGGLVEVENEQRVRGAVERTYRLRPARTAMSQDAIARMSTEDHRHGFVAAVAALLGEFDAYLDRADANPLADAVSYRQFPLWLSDAEKAALIEQLVALILPLMEQRPTAERRRHLLSTILFPADAERGTATGER